MRLSGQFFFAATATLFCLASAYMAQGFNSGARFFPLGISLFGAATFAVITILSLFSGRREERALDASTDSAPFSFMFLFFAACLAFVGAVYLVGVLPALLVGSLAFTQAAYRFPLRYTVLIMVTIIVTFFLMTRGLSLRWPDGLLVPDMTRTIMRSLGL